MNLKRSRSCRSCLPGRIWSLSARPKHTKTMFRMRLARQDDPVASYYELCDQKAGGAEENEDEDVTLLPIQP